MDSCWVQGPSWSGRIDLYSPSTYPLAGSEVIWALLIMFAPFQYRRFWAPAVAEAIPATRLGSYRSPGRAPLAPVLASSQEPREAGELSRAVAAKRPPGRSGLGRPLSHGA